MTPASPLEDGDHRLDAVAQGVLGEGPLARPLADVERLVGVGEVVVELLSQLAQVAVHDRLFPRGKELGELVLGVHQLARRTRRGPSSSRRVRRARWWTPRTSS